MPTGPIFGSAFLDPKPTTTETINELPWAYQEAGRLMGELLTGIDFKARTKAYTKQPAQQPAQPHEAELAAMFASGLDTDPEVLAAFYESSLGYASYLAPESDPA